jgi:hypothetical protein
MDSGIAIVDRRADAAIREVEARSPRHLLHCRRRRPRICCLLSRRRQGRLRVLETRMSRVGPRVCRLAAGGRRIRTIGPWRQALP